MKNNEKYGEINFGKERIYKSELDHIQYAGESPERESVEDLYGAGADTATFDKRNDATLQEIAFTIRYFKELEKDAQSPDAETRYRARIKMELFNNGCHPEKINGCWKMMPGSRIRGGDKR